jgi:hypothetical protein
LLYGDLHSSFGAFRCPLMRLSSKEDGTLT